MDARDVVRPGARIIVEEMAGRCLAERGIIVSVLEALLLDKPVWDTDPTEGALGERLRQNIPTGPIDAPLLIAQGTEDTIVAVGSQDGYVEQRCEAGQAIDYRRYPGEEHVSLVEPASPLVPDLIEWTAQRFAGTVASSTC